MWLFIGTLVVYYNFSLVVPPATILVGTQGLLGIVLRDDVHLKLVMMIMIILEDVENGVY